LTSKTRIRLYPLFSVKALFTLEHARFFTEIIGGCLVELVGQADAAGFIFHVGIGEEGVGEETSRRLAGGLEFAVGLRHEISADRLLVVVSDQGAVPQIFDVDHHLIRNVRMDVFLRDGPVVGGGREAEIQQ